MSTTRCPSFCVAGPTHLKDMDILGQYIRHILKCRDRKTVFPPGIPIPRCNLSTNTFEVVMTGAEKTVNPKLRPCTVRGGTKRAVVVTITSRVAAEAADGQDGRGEREGDEETIHAGDLRNRTRLETRRRTLEMAQNAPYR